MKQFVFAYRAPKGYVPGSEETIAAWQGWLGGMGGALLDYGKPAFTRAGVGDCTSEATELGGYSIVQADDLDSALEIAAGCPYVGDGGGVEVGELADVPGSEVAK